MDSDAITRQLEDWEIRHQQRLQEEIAKRGPRNGWIKEDAVEIFIQDGHECWIWKNDKLWKEMEMVSRRSPDLFPSPAVGYNGYVVFKEKPVIEPGYKGILTYVPVHGGITYVCHDELGSVYGFDTSHHDSPKFPIRDLNWIKGELDVMTRGIIYAASIEEEYLKADGDNHTRARLLQPLAALRPTSPNFGTMLNLLSGEL